MLPVLVWEDGQEPGERAKVDFRRELTLSSAVCAARYEFPRCSHTPVTEAYLWFCFTGEEAEAWSMPHEVGNVILTVVMPGQTKAQRDSVPRQGG